HLLEETQLLHIDERLRAEQTYFRLPTGDLSLPHVDQRRLTDPVPCLRELQEFFVALQRLLRQVSLRARLQDGQVLLLDPCDQRVFRSSDVSIDGMLLGFGESWLGQRAARHLPRESYIID